MKLIWVLPENKGQNSNFRPNRVKPHVNQSTSDRAVQHYWSIGSVHTGRPDRSTGQPHWSIDFHVIRSTALVDRCNQLRERSSRKSIQNLQIQSQIEIFQRETTRSGF
ncbi:hypothetical protein L484_001560 [Morus notabilis]|uniref:Uncharacterized protein n=1 Tax=Morus notabilis TaxID=981085 RepID=W9QTP5_9ROSA|nr:hypothetical protein L484_001560 [Morus notabilis]